MVNQKQFDAARAKIIEKVWKDPEFKKRFMQNPKAALKEMGIQVPDNIQLNVVEEKKNSYTFVIPFSNGAVREELSEKDLMKVAAGASSWPC
ncbi:MAG: NHLP leader peptide family RiPP precursor [Chlamydiales bacterium]